MGASNDVVGRQRHTRFLQDYRDLLIAVQVISDLDIYRSAKLLVDQHGADAPIEAAMRVDAMLEAGDLDGRAVWRRILPAVEELLSEERPEGAGVH